VNISIDLHTYMSYDILGIQGSFAEIQGVAEGCAKSQTEIEDLFVMGLLADA